MNKFFPLLLIFILVMINFSCDKNHDSELPDLTPPELTYLQLNGVDIIDDTIYHSRGEQFNLRFNLDDNDRVLEGEFGLIINKLEELSRTVDKVPGQTNYKFRYGLQNLEEFHHLKGTDKYVVQLNDQIEFNMRAIDPSNNLTEKSITVIVF